jgi:hypothetical protein
MGVGVLWAVAWAVSEMLPPELRVPVRATLAMGAALQLPLGWWLISSVGSERWLVPWVVGILARLTGLAVIGLVVMPSLGWQPESPLLAVVLLFVGTLLIEGLVLWTEHFGTRA